MTTTEADRGGPVAAYLARPRRQLILDGLIALFVLTLAIAVVVNAVADVRDTRRTKFDKKVWASWHASHPQLGRFGFPVIIVHQRRDLACAPIRPRAAAQKPLVGHCIVIRRASPKDATILRDYRCLYTLRLPRGVRPDAPPCPQRGLKVKLKV